jgi:hypothetical protein
MRTDRRVRPMERRCPVDHGPNIVAIMGNFDILFCLALKPYLVWPGLALGMGLNS